MRQLILNSVIDERVLQHYSFLVYRGPHTFIWVKNSVCLKY